MASQDFNRLKDTGGTRLSRIRDILKQALSETLAEVQEGSGEVRQILKESISSSLESSQSSEDVLIVETNAVEADDTEGNQAQIPPSSRSLIELLVAWARTQKLGSWPEKYQLLKARMELIDQQLAERYGDRYQTVKDQANSAANSATVWYKATRAKVDAGEETPGETFQRRLSDRAQGVGAAIAQRETEIKQRVQTMWQSR